MPRSASSSWASAAAQRFWRRGRNCRLPLQQRAIVISKDLGFEELFQRPGQAGAGTVDWHRRLRAVARGELIRTARASYAVSVIGLAVRSASAISNCFAGTAASFCQWEDCFLVIPRSRSARLSS